jgi:hypothetical protein
MLVDGRNAHLIQQPPAWWLPRMMARFELIAFNRMEHGFWVIVEPFGVRAAPGHGSDR